MNKLIDLIYILLPATGISLCPDHVKHSIFVLTVASMYLLAPISDNTKAIYIY